jgi:predicted MFS family arabinose efflux permease
MGATSLGNALSTAVGGIVGQFLSWRALFGTYGVLSLGVALAMMRFARDPGTSNTVAAPRGGLAATFTRYGEVLRIDRARFLYGLVLIEGMAVQGGFTYMGAYLEERFGLPYLWIGLVLACNGVGTLATSRVVRRLRRRWDETELVLVGGLLMAASYLVTLMLPWWPLIALPMLAAGGGFTLFHTTMQTAATELVPELRGTAVSMFGFSLFLGAGIGTAGLGLLLDRAGLSTVLVVCGVVLALLTLVAWQHWRVRAAKHA